jgi:hypothetical protein
LRTDGRPFEADLPEKTRKIGVWPELPATSSECPGNVYFADSLLIPQNELNMVHALIPEFDGKREEDPVRFLLQAAEAILEKTSIHIA